MSDEGHDDDGHGHGNAAHQRENHIEHDHGEDEDGGHRHDEGHEEDDHGHSHDHHHHDLTDIGVGVITVSSSRSMDDDPSGDAIESAVEDAGHTVVVRELVRDDFDGVQGTVARLVERDDVDIVVTTGGTGVTPDDVTVEAVRPLFDKELPGFGELFRRLSYDDIGTTVVATRAVAGVANGCPVFCLPGSRAAVELGVEDIVLPEAPHLAGLARRDDDEEEE
ncbi:MogA/MoaB family molybdenum cofactor biosynthesis protein [Haloarchaeobius sp. DFWS5]|uniref:MogA/MoaB family molybdenum cofactor biosynthesis protein n=1 Tax=Haloarchaeobius sp. DFWS5 TaxID=3446114 RepID=UPI003EBEB32E